MKKPFLIILLGALLYPGQMEVIAQPCDTRQLDPRIASFLKLIGKQDFTLEEIRALPIEEIKFAGPPYRSYPRDDVQRIKITADSIPVLVFNPLHAQDLPIIINYHGGGFISPLLPALEYSLWQEARSYEAIVFAVDYRVAPENRFPAAVNDSYEAFRWIAEYGNKYGGDLNRIALMGNSAGANLVAVVTHKAKNNGLGDIIKLQIMNGLPIDLRPENMETAVSYQENAKGYFQTKALTYFTVETYAPGQYNNPEVSPILYENFTDLPPAVIINAEFDPLRDDGILYAQNLRAAGVKVWDKCFPGQIHCLIGLPPDAAELREYEAIVKTAMADSFRISAEKK